jgi:cell wall-associated NlpC family hydrolase
MDRKVLFYLAAGGLAAATSWTIYHLLVAYNPEEDFEAPPEEPDVPSDAAPIQSVRGDGTTPTGAELLASAVKYEGVPYSFGKATREDGFDCSSLPQRAAADIGVQIPRTASVQYLASKNAGLAEISEEQARNTPGAFVWFYDMDAPAGSKRALAFHVAMSTGDGRVFEAQGSGTNVGYYKWGWWHNWFKKKAGQTPPQRYGVRYGLMPGFSY